MLELDNKNIHKELIKEIENRLQFVITISIFFLALISYFFKSLGENESKINDMLRSWGGIIVFYLLSYLFFEFFKREIRGKFLKVLDFSLLIGIFAFVMPIAVLCTKEFKSFSIIESANIFLFKTSLYALPLISILILFAIIIFYILSLYGSRKIKKSNIL